LDGQYGAGTVMVSDKGNTKDGVPANKQLARGKLDVGLHGAKRRGGFTLVRTGKAFGRPCRQEQWLIIKHHDECADSGLGR
jgi:bifunctional non-homologous end joining protein LigD